MEIKLGKVPFTTKMGADTLETSLTGLEVGKGFTMMLLVASTLVTIRETN